PRGNGGLDRRCRTAWSGHRECRDFRGHRERAAGASRADPRDLRRQSRRRAEHGAAGARSDGGAESRCAGDARGIRGRIAVIASPAALVGAPGAPAYCASKSAVDAWTVATAHTARQQGILMTSVCPGYIRTDMTAGNRFPMPGLMDAERAATIILRGIAAGR